jgi:hypothetical protein
MNDLGDIALTPNHVQNRISEAPFVDNYSKVEQGIYFVTSYK